MLFPGVRQSLWRCRPDIHEFIGFMGLAEEFILLTSLTSVFFDLRKSHYFFFWYFAVELMGCSEYCWVSPCRLEIYGFIGFTSVVEEFCRLPSPQNVPPTSVSHAAGFIFISMRR